MKKTIFSIIEETKSNKLDYKIQIPAYISDEQLDMIYQVLDSFMNLDTTDNFIELNEMKRKKTTC